MKKVILVKPYNRSDHIQPSLGLGWLAQNIRDIADVEILDCIKNKIDSNEKFIEIISCLKPDIIGIQCYSFDIFNVKETLQAIKKFNQNIITVIGGPHPTLIRGGCFDFFGETLNYIFVGESEIGFRNFLNGNEFSGISGFGYRKNGEIYINEPQFHNNLDELGYPAWDLIRPETYPEAQHGAFFENFPIAQIMITRGCPFDCTFCAGNKISGKQVRFRTVNSVISEMKMLYYDYGIREFHIIDDNFIINRKYTLNLLNEFKNIGFKFSWATPNGVRLDCLDADILSLMKETGIYLISLGIESGSDRILKFIKKNITVAKITEKIELIRKHNIDVAGFFIIGLPTETRNEILKTINFSVSLPLVRANYFTFLPFPGTESYEFVKNENRENVIDKEKFYFMNAAYTPEGISRTELKNLQRLAFLKFYFRFNILWYNISRIKNVKHLIFLIKRFINWIVKPV
ncbi:B12-binding domain-containing radical SAM protein [Candidatus Dependentiae bacterium]|nr:B12-binding domain-containing radical SAM protein [Candidatus Dependentiae bacterium]